VVQSHVTQAQAGTALAYKGRGSRSNVENARGEHGGKKSMAILTLSASRPTRHDADSARHSLPKVVPIEQYRGIVLLPRKSANRAKPACGSAPKSFDAA
jgi:hypothetical protein